MVGIGESYLAAFVLAAGLGEISAGLVATVPLLAGAVLQLVSPAAVRRLRSHRRWVVTCALLQAASFAPLIVQALRGDVSRTWVFAAAAAYWGFGMGTGPAWNTWVGTLIPSEERARFFALRSRWCQVAVLAGVLGGGAWLELGGGRSGHLGFFAGLFAIAAAARLASAGFLASQSEPVPYSDEHRHVSFVDFARRFRTRDGSLLGYLLSMQIAVNLSAPFFAPYLLGPLALSYGRFTVLIATVFAARIAALPALGRLAHRHGARWLLWAGGLGIVPLPLLWMLTDWFPALVAMQVASGVAWGALELAILLSYFEHIPEAERTGVLTIFNLANAAAIAGGASLGSVLFAHLGPSRASYFGLFALSGGMRALSLGVLRGVADVAAPEAPLELRTVAVSPTEGALQGPVLPTAQADPEP